ncbi:MAG: MarR family transcriptional regulator [bacterium]|nr:MarR family transcriptional regulator [bacterium]
MSHLENRTIALKTLEIIPVIMRVMSAQMRVGVTPISTTQIVVMRILLDKRETLSELAKQTQVTLPTMSNTISTLEERGWVSRERDAQDRRVVWIEITPLGREIYQQAQDHMIDQIAALLETLSRDEQEQVSGALSMLNAAFAAAIAQNPHALSHRFDDGHQGDDGHRTDNQQP